METRWGRGEGGRIMEALDRDWVVWGKGRVEGEGANGALKRQRTMRHDGADGGGTGEGKGAERTHAVFGPDLRRSHGGLPSGLAQTHYVRPTTFQPSAPPEQDASEPTNIKRTCRQRDIL